MDNKLDIEIIDLIRQIMYGGSENGDVLYQQTIDLANMLSKRDGVRFNIFRNRLIKLMDVISIEAPEQWDNIEHLNDDPNASRRDSFGKLQLLNEKGEVVARQG